MQCLLTYLIFACSHRSDEADDLTELVFVHVGISVKILLLGPLSGPYVLFAPVCDSLALSGRHVAPAGS